MLCGAALHVICQEDIIAVFNFHKDFDPGMKFCDTFPLSKDFESIHWYIFFTKTSKFFDKSVLKMNYAAQEC